MTTKHPNKTHIGTACTCGSRRRYTSTGRCVPCTTRRTNAWKDQQPRAALKAYRDGCNRKPLAVVKRAYANALRLCKGLNGSSLMSAGLPFDIDKDAFIRWSLNDSPFMTLHTAWARAGYARALAPALMRTVKEKGYVWPSNVVWVTQTDSNRSISSGRKLSQIRRKKFGK